MLLENARGIWAVVQTFVMKISVFISVDLTPRPTIITFVLNYFPILIAIQIPLVLEGLHGRFEGTVSFHHGFVGLTEHTRACVRLWR